MNYKDALRQSKKCPSCCSKYKYDRSCFKKERDVEKENKDEDEVIEVVVEKKENDDQNAKYPWE